MTQKYNLHLLKENLDLLLQHVNEIQHVPAYYHSRILSNADSRSYDQLGSILLGPYLEFWKHVPVNNAGKLLLTYGLTCTYGWRGQTDLTDNDLELESGFRYKKPLPGVSLYQLQDIMYRYMKQFLKPDLPMGAPLELVLQELKEEKPLQQRASQKYDVVRDRLTSAATDATGTDGLYHVPDDKISEYRKWNMYVKPKQPPVTFWIAQENDMRLKVYITVEAPVKELSTHGITGERLSFVDLNDMMLACLAAFDPLLEQYGFTKMKAGTSVTGGGLEATYTCIVNSPDDILITQYLTSFGDLIRSMYQIIRQQGLQACAGLS